MSLTAGCSREIFPGLSDKHTKPPSTSASLPPTAKDPAEENISPLATPTLQAGAISLIDGAPGLVLPRVLEELPCGSISQPGSRY